MLDTPFDETQALDQAERCIGVAYSVNRVPPTVAWLSLLTILALGASGNAMAADAGSDGTASQIRAAASKGVDTILDDVHALLVRPLTMDRADAVLLGGGLAVVGAAFATDHALRQLVLHHPSQTGRKVSDDIGTGLGPGPVAGLSAGVTLLGLLSNSAGYERARTSGLVALEAEGIAVGATAVLKLVAGRSAPDANQGTADFRPFGRLDGSFVSTHAAASFAVATVFAERYPGPIAWGAYTLAATVSASRIYSEQHFGSDVIAGALLGWGIGYFLANRHADSEEAWQVRPVALDRGLGSGILIGRRF